ncbi:hypothetical protein GQ457_01G022760 [Hibiscus cannabinus]
MSDASPSPNTMVTSHLLSSFDGYPFQEPTLGTNSDDKKSTFGHCLYLGNNLVPWSSKKQNVVSWSSTESEFRSLANAMCNAIRLYGVINTNAIVDASNHVHHAKSKHVEIDLGFVRKKVVQGLFHISYVHVVDQVAYVFTKPLFVAFFVRLRQQLHVVFL